MAGFPTLGAVTPVSGLLAPEPPEQAAMARPVQQQSKTAMPGRARLVRAVRPEAVVTLTIASFLSRRCDLIRWGRCREPWQAWSSAGWAAGPGHCPPASSRGL